MNKCINLTTLFSAIVFAIFITSCSKDNKAVQQQAAQTAPTAPNCDTFAMEAKALPGIETVRVVDSIGVTHIMNEIGIGTSGYVLPTDPIVYVFNAREADPTGVTLSSIVLVLGKLSDDITMKNILDTDAGVIAPVCGRKTITLRSSWPPDPSGFLMSAWAASWPSFQTIEGETAEFEYLLQRDGQFFVVRGVKTAGFLDPTRRETFNVYWKLTD